MAWQEIGVKMYNMYVLYQIDVDMYKMEEVVGEFEECSFMKFSCGSGIRQYDIEHSNLLPKFKP
jgi:hypothetical protein